MGYLPVVTTSFIGRETELDAVERALQEHRLVTLTGGGGVGKSRLALRAADRARARHPDGVWWADLSPLQDDRLLIATVCDAVGLLDHSPRRPVEALGEWLAGRRALLVLDCCERVIVSCAGVVADLLDAAPALTVLATSRQPLGIAGEHLLDVGPLPAGGAGQEAVRLFHDRAATAAPDVPLDTPAAAAAVAEICHRLEGIPLAVELACARLRENGVEQIAARLRDTTSGAASGAASPFVSRTTARLDVLADDSVWPQRHRALRTAIGWSHELCAPLERLLWARLSVFPGAVDVADARAVCAGGPLAGHDVPVLLERLAAQSVLQRDGDRYRMLDTLREYGTMWLAELGERDLLATRHAGHFAETAALAHAGWLGPRQVAWYRRIADCHADLCAALDHLLAEEPERAMRMAGHTGLFWSCCGHLHEARAYLERALSRTSARGPDRIRALWALGITRTLQGDHEDARRLGEECSLAAWHDQDPESVLSAAHSVSFTYLMMGRPRSALTVADRALRHVTSAPHDAPSHLRCRVIRLFALSALGRLDEAYEDAADLQQLSLGYGEHWARAYADHQLALIELLRGRARDAERHARAMLAGKYQLRDSLGIALGLDLLAGAIAARGDGVAAARTSGTGHTYWRMIGHPHRGTPELGAIRDEWERRAREAAGDPAYESAYQLGLVTDAESGLALALRGHLPS
ncbi:regulator [Streptomyces sp. NPDC093109]|uniref:ATP-binding protein n=1 Tax=Streptomyces sp. NPDC093109 TaxID=3154977 RepID=UPI00344DEC5C